MLVRYMFCFNRKEFQIQGRPIPRFQDCKISGFQIPCFTTYTDRLEVRNKTPTQLILWHQYELSHFATVDTTKKRKWFNTKVQSSIWLLHQILLL